MKHFVLQAMLPIVVLAGGIGIAMGVANRPGKPAEQKPPPLSPLVETVTVLPHTGTLDLAVDGVVAPFREIQIASEVGGRVIFKSPRCRAGRFVQQGTILIRIDPQDYELEVERLSAQWEQSTSRIDELDVEIANTASQIVLARKDLELQQDELERIVQLSQEGVISESELDRARQTELTSRSTLLNLENQERLLTSRGSGLSQARRLVKAELEKAKLALERTKILAPVDGVVVQDNVEKDGYIQKGTALLTLEDTQAVEVICSLKMEELYWIWLQQADPATEVTPGRVYQLPETPVTVTYRFASDDRIEFQWSGVLSRYDGIGVSEATRTIPCRVLVANPRGVTQESLVGEIPDGVRTVAPPALVRGMFVVVEFHLNPPANLLQIPERAVRPGKAVWVARDNKLRVVKPISLIERVDERRDEKGQPFWVVDGNRSGLSGGDRLVVTPMVVVTDGMSIREQSQ